MENKLDKGIRTYTRAVSETEDSVRDPRALLVATVLYLVVLLTMPLDNLSGLIWFGIYPVVGAALAGFRFGRIFSKSLLVLPLSVVIGIFNPWFDHGKGMRFGNLEISHGWLTFISIIVRGLYAVQALLLLTESCGFIGMCRAMRRLYMPSFLTTQLEMVYRYCGVLMQEAQNMLRAREARGYGRKVMDLKMWGPMIGQLFLRSVDRAQRIHLAMLLRGFNGTMPDYCMHPRRWTLADTVYLAAWTIVILLLRFLNPQLLF